MKNLLAEKVIAALRKIDSHAHRNINIMTVSEDAVRHIFGVDEYLKNLSDREHDGIAEEMSQAEAARSKAMAEAAELAAERKKQTDEIKRQRIDAKLARQKQIEDGRKARKAESRKAFAEAKNKQENLNFLLPKKEKSKTLKPKKAK